MRDEKRKRSSSNVLVSALLVGLMFFSLGSVTVFADSASDSNSQKLQVEVLGGNPVDAETQGDDAEPITGGKSSANPNTPPGFLVTARDGVNNFFQQFKDIWLFGDNNEWALVNLILAIIGFIVAIVAVCSFGKKYKRVACLIITFLLGIAGAFVFFLTEDMARQVVVVDSWTILAAIIFVVEIIFYDLSFKYRR